MAVGMISPVAVLRDGAHFKEARAPPEDEELRMMHAAALGGVAPSSE